MSNTLYRFYVLKAEKYGEPFAQCDTCYHRRKQQWTDNGLIVESIGKTDWECSDSNHGKWKEPPAQPLEAEAG